MQRMLRGLAPALLALVALNAPAGADAAGREAAAPKAKPAFPEITLPEARSHGQRAVDLLGTRLPEVAGWYGKSPEELRNLLRRDRMLKIDRRGRMFVEEELAQPLQADTAAADAAASDAAVQTGALAPLEQTYLLHSRPGAKRTVYLNFRGAQLSNTAWNGGGATITALPFDLDGVPYTNSSAELTRIQYIWQRVAEDFAPFDVNVTTEPPPAAALTRSSSADDTFGTTVLITKRSGVYDCSCGGVAYIGVFDDTSEFYKPALVFYDALGSGNEKYVAEAITHEAGHNLSLLHDGYSGGGYYGGHGSGATGWAPIMGVGYSQALVQWSKGEYATANNTQDDYALMVSTGLPLRADDHGNNAGSATALAGTTAGGLSVFGGAGVIERPTDVDVFAFSAGAGPATLSVTPAARSPNVDLQLELRNGAGQLLASANPADTLAASISLTLPAAGTYTVSVRGVGKGDPLTTGYTAYGSTGHYALAGQATPAGGQPPLAVLGANPTRGTVPLTVDFSSAGSSDADGSIVAQAWAFGDGGNASGATARHVYQTAGSYTAQLQVTDDSGLSSTRSVTITVDPVITAMPMGVGDIAMSLVKVTSSKYRADARVSVRTGDGRLLAGATVSGRWSGIVAGNGSAVTGSDGVALLRSPSTRNRGTYTFTVTGIALSGHAYRSTLNTETSDSITR